MQPTQGDKARKHRTATSEGMIRSAAQRRCPSCGRKSALKSRTDAGGFKLIWCRWKDCKYECGSYIGGSGA